ncbi:uncharacterized protein LOC129774600 [Toxorhynchites rutilus septentrionalis]|uniref:uncharacterized protein LOC129774600 n=1 Tax=Toxorhynchites rutilus septentrionalis TaxID=329112 RepID=UPI002479B87A|nr:uncharacterized protein LOC129774600 [Toxorhynchites rutilus septentrionalis]
MVYPKSLVLPRIDDSPPILFVDNILHSTKLVHDIRRQREIARENKELLKRINRICRTKGFLGVKYDYKSKKMVNWEAREQEAKQIQRANLVLLARILNVRPEIIRSEQEKSYRNLLQYRGICAKHSKQNFKDIRNAETITDSHSIKMEFCEHDDRRLGCIKIRMYKTNVHEYMLSEGIKFIRGEIYHIYKDQYIVIRGHFSVDNTLNERKKQLIENVKRGSFVRAILNDQPALLITLTFFKRLANCQLLGQVVPTSDALLNLLNYYGTTYGRLLEPICFQIKTQNTN